MTGTGPPVGSTDHLVLSGLWSHSYCGPRVVLVNV